MTPSASPISRSSSRDNPAPVLVNRMSDKIALVGCGAIAESYHLPALARVLSPAGRLVLVDSSEDRLQAMRREFGAAEVVRSHRDVLGRVAGAILAVPQQLHHAFALEFLEAGAHVLSEKPLARTAEEADELLAAVQTTGHTLSVNNSRRLFPSMRKVAELLREGSLGEPVAFEFVLGEVFDWPAATNSYFGAEAGGRGVFLDIGAHVIDLVCWWLGGEVDIDAYEDDAHGGTEGVARLTFTSGECRGEVRLSWLSRLRNHYRITCEHGSIRGGVYDLDRLWIRDAKGRESMVRPGGPGQDRDALAERMLANFVGVVEGREEPLIPAEEVAESIRVIDRCYRQRERMELPWLRPDEEFLNA